MKYSQLPESDSEKSSESEWPPVPQGRQHNVPFLLQTGVFVLLLISNVGWILTLWSIPPRPVGIDECTKAGPPRHTPDLLRHLSRSASQDYSYRSISRYDLWRYWREEAASRLSLERSLPLYVTDRCSSTECVD